MPLPHHLSHGIDQQIGLRIHLVLRHGHAILPGRDQEGGSDDSQQQ